MHFLAAVVAFLGAIGMIFAFLESDRRASKADWLFMCSLVVFLVGIVGAILGP